MLSITLGFAVLLSRTVVTVSFLVTHAVTSHPTLPHPHLPRLLFLPLLPLEGCQYLVNSGQFQLFLNLGANEKQALELATVRQRVAAVLRRTPNKPVLVWGDREVAYGDVVVVMTALQEAGAPSVGLVTESPAGD